MAQARQGNPLFAETEDTTRVQRSNVPAPDRTEMIMAEGQARLDIGQSIGQAGVAVATVIQREQDKKLKQDQIAAQEEHRVKQNDYRNAMRAARSKEAKAEVKRNYLEKEVNGYARSQYSTGTDKLASNRAKEWYRDEVLPKLRADADIVYADSLAQMEMLEREAKFNTTTKSIVTKTPLWNIKEGIASLNEVNKEWLGIERAKTILPEQTEAMVKNAVQTHIEEVTAALDSGDATIDEMAIDKLEQDIRDTAGEYLSRDVMEGYSEELEAHRGRIRLQERKRDENAEREQRAIYDANHETLWDKFADVSKQVEYREGGTALEELRQNIRDTALPAKEKLMWEERYQKLVEGRTRLQNAINKPIKTDERMLTALQKMEIDDAIPPSQYLLAVDQAEAQNRLSGADALGFHKRARTKLDSDKEQIHKEFMTLFFQDAYSTEGFQVVGRDHEPRTLVGSVVEGKSKVITENNRQLQMMKYQVSIAAKAWLSKQVDPSKPPTLANLQDFADKELKEVARLNAEIGVAELLEQFKQSAFKSRGTMESVRVSDGKRRAIRRYKQLRAAKGYKKELPSDPNIPAPIKDESLNNILKEIPEEVGNKLMEYLGKPPAREIKAETNPDDTFADQQ